MARHSLLFPSCMPLPIKVPLFVHALLQITDSMGQIQSLARHSPRALQIGKALAEAPAAKGASRRRGYAQNMPPLVWIDVETTGLVVEKDVVLEVAMVLTDSDLNRITDPMNVVISHPPETLQHLNAWSQKWHAASGLLDDVAKSTLTMGEAEQQLLRVLVEHCSTPNQAILAGNNVGFDRKFIEKCMPTLSGYLHFRNLDVSTVNEIAKRWAPEILRNYRKTYTHRAIDDISESLRELRYYKDTMFRAAQK
ncbi:ribonuclease H-like protein [Martensiomyces pterosporus]|nr:ribonuclease H-like protein [Martensiomyces pterosporus]